MEAKEKYIKTREMNNDQIKLMQNSLVSFGLVIPWKQNLNRSFDPE